MGIGGKIKLEEGTAGGTYVGFKAPDTEVASDLIWVLPSVDGSNGQFLATDGSGTLSWGSVDMGAEITARSNADSTLQGNINSEITARTNADSTLQSNLNTEITARSNADSTLQTNINNCMAKNYIINGGFDFWQRGSSFAAAGGAYTADRWILHKQGASVMTVSKSTNVPTSSSSIGSYLVTITTADSSVDAADMIIIQYGMEGNDLRFLKGKTFTLSFSVKSSKTGTFCALIGNSARNRTYIKEYTINSANTWESKALTFTHDTTGDWNYDTNCGMNINFCLMAGSSFQGSADTWLTTDSRGTSNQVNFADTLGATFQLSDVRINEGLVSQKFELYGSNITGELSACQRYYEKSYELNVAPGTTGTGGELVAVCGGSYGFWSIKFTVPKRSTSPTLTIWNNSTGAQNNWRRATNNADYSVTTANINRFVCEIRAASIDGLGIDSYYHQYTCESEF